jgi:aromatic ring-opening dioxygenase catalytic subunit (LigB family)
MSERQAPEDDERSEDDRRSRRELLKATAITGVAASAVLAATQSIQQQPARAASASDRRTSADGSAGRMPVISLPHGGGPWPFTDLPLGSREEKSALLAYLRELPSTVPTPRAIVVLSAHWEEPVFTVMTAERPPLLFDYYGFPEETYRLEWPAPGSPLLAARVRALLLAAHLPAASDPRRGFDHGTFVPLKVAWPAADVPIVQVSLKTGLDPAEHIALGRALAPLRDEGVLIVGSGMSYHNMRGFGGRGRAASEAFDRWLGDVVQRTGRAREDGLAQWERAPSAREAHPREEHLAPLFVIAGAAGDDRATIPYRGTFADVRISAHHFG